MGYILFAVVAVCVFWVATTYGMDTFGDLFPKGFWAEWWLNVQDNLGFHITTFLIGALLMTLIGALKSR